MEQAQAQGQPRRKYRNFLLDSRFQLKFAGYFVAMTLVVAVFLGVFLARTTGSFFEQMNNAVDARSKAAETNRELGTCTLNNDLARSIDDPAFAQRLEARSKKIDAQYEAETQSVMADRARLVSEHQHTLIILVAVLLAFIVAIALGAIVITHRIVGPLFRIKRMAREVQSGSMRPPTYGLRPGDELHDLFDVFSAMVTDLRARTEADLKALDASLGGDRATLERLKAEVQSRLDK